MDLYCVISNSFHITRFKTKLIYLDEENAHKIDEVIFNGLLFTFIPFYINLDKVVSRIKLTRLELTQFILIIVIVFLSESRASLFTLLAISSVAYVFKSKYNFSRRL